MNIKEENPPFQIRELCEVKFNTIGVKPIFTYGDCIYNPLKAPVDKFLVAHELVHKDQQGDQPAKWWNKWMDDDAFRFEQEWQAYFVQFAVIKKDVKDRNRIARVLHALAGDLSGTMYGKLCSYTEARQLIQYGKPKQ